MQYIDSLYNEIISLAGCSKRWHVHVDAELVASYKRPFTLHPSIIHHMNQIVIILIKEPRLRSQYQVDEFQRDL